MNDYVNLLLVGLFLLVSGLFFFVKRKHGIWDPFSPWRIFPSVWFAGLGISSLHLSSFDRSWSSLTLFIFVTAPIFYLLGCYLVLALKQKKVLPDVIELGVISFEPNLDRKRYLLLLTILLVISASVLIFEFIRLGAIPFFSNPNVTRWDVAYNSYVHRIALTLIQVAALGGVFLAVFRRDSRTKDWFIALSISLISLILVFLLSSRLFLMMAVVVPLVAASYFWFRPNRLITGILLLSSLSLTGLLSLVRFIASDNDWFLRYMSNLGFKGWSAYFGPFYQNIAYNYEVFDRLISYIPDKLSHFYGAISAYPVLVFLGHGQRVTGVIGETPIVNSGFVASTYLGAFYADFGFVGVIFGSLALGAMATIVYSILGSRPSILIGLIYSSIIWNLLFTPYENLFVLFDFWWAIVLFALFVLLVKSPLTFKLWKS